MVKKRRPHSAARSFRTALEGSKSINQLSSEYEIYPKRFQWPPCRLSGCLIPSSCRHRQRPKPAPACLPTPRGIELSGDRDR